MLIAACGLGGILGLTLGPLSQDRALDAFRELLGLAAAALGRPEPGVVVAEAVANVVLFVPLGLAGGWLVRRGREPWVVVALGLLAVAVEAVQYPTAGRDASLRDVVLNSLGGLLGVAVALLGKLWVRRRRRRRGPTASASA